MADAIRPRARRPRRGQASLHLHRPQVWRGAHDCVLPDARKPHDRVAGPRASPTVVLEKQPERRCESLHALADDLERACEALPNEFSVKNATTKARRHEEALDKKAFSSCLRAFVPSWLRLVELDMDRDVLSSASWHS